jgi:glycosyltransferase involved in cell wall biosynthesis
VNAATMVAIPSRYREPFALVAVEAAHLGRPVIAARTGGLAGTVADGETGILFETGSSTALASAIGLLLDHPETAARLGEAGRRRAPAAFGLDACVDAYDHLYHQLRHDPTRSGRA